MAKKYTDFPWLQPDNYSNAVDPEALKMATKWTISASSTVAAWKRILGVNLSIDHVRESKEKIEAYMTKRPGK